MYVRARERIQVVRELHRNFELCAVLKRFAPDHFFRPACAREGNVQVHVTLICSVSTNLNER